MEAKGENIPISSKGAAQGCSGRGEGGHSVLLVLRRGHGGSSEGRGEGGDEEGGDD